MTKISSAPLFVLSLSGGLDSTVLCADLLARHGAGSVLPVFFEYGSKHNPWEKEAALAVAGHYSLSLRVVDLTRTFSHMTSALLASDTRDIPKAAYDQRSMHLTAVPGRNLIFGSVLAALAESHGIPAMALATHSGDHHIYPDCRPAFNEALGKVVERSTEGRVRVLTPFSAVSKNDIVTLGIRLNAPFHLTRSCYQAESASCGGCGACVERLEAFAANGTVDPIPYHFNSGSELS